MQIIVLVFDLKYQSADLTVGHNRTEMGTYLIFVIFFTQAKFLEYKIYTEKRVNYNKLHSELPILRVNYDKLHSKLPILRVKSVKIYTGQFFLHRPRLWCLWQIKGMRLSLIGEMN